MTFELPQEAYDSVTPLREELTTEMGHESWMVPISKLEELVEGDSNLREMLDEVFDQCLRYTMTVVDELNLRATEGPGENHSIKDEERSRTHTATQDTLTAFARNLVKAGKTAEQIYPLLPNVRSRAACGQFALRLTLTRGFEISENK